MDGCIHIFTRISTFYTIYMSYILLVPNRKTVRMLQDLSLSKFSYNLYLYKELILSVCRVYVIYLRHLFRTPMVREIDLYL